MSGFITRQYNHSKVSRLPFYWAVPFYALVSLLLASAEYLLSSHGFDWLATILWYFPVLLAMAYPPIFLVRLIGIEIFKIGALRKGDPVEITAGEHCGFTGRILQIYPGQNAIRVLIETISGTKIDLILKREQLCKLHPKSESKVLAE